MNYTEFEKKFEDICLLINENQLIKAISILEEIIDFDKNNDNKIELKKLKETYFYMLKYSALGIEDKQRDKIYNSLLKSFLELSDKVKESIYTDDVRIASYDEKRKIKKFAIKLSNKLNYFVNSDSSEIPDNEYNDLFNLFLNVNKITDEELNLINKFFSSERINIYNKCNILSAITLNLFHNFDKNKFNTLLKTLEINKNQIKLRALTGLILGLYIHKERLKYYPEIELKLELLFEDAELKKYFELIFLQLIKSKETENIVQKLKDEILPEMMKITPKINEKLNLDKIISDSLIEDKNPDWEEIFEDAPNVLDKMQELSELQLEGSDVLMGTFSMLKYFPFFKKIKNWFVPFYQENPEIQSFFDDQANHELLKTAAQGLEKSAYICNSDKYSFFLNIGNLPQIQKNMIVNLFKMESDAMEEIKKDDLLLNKNTEAKDIITQYIQDLYRFFKLYPNKKEFFDIFSTNLDLYNLSFFDLLVENTDSYRNIAELYFKKNYFEDAIKIFELISKKGENNSEIFEKIAYSYQRLLQYDKALENYKKAEFFDVNTFWITKKIAFCYLKLNNFEKALEYYKKAEKENEEDLHIQTNIGLCYVNLEDTQNALKHYFKVEYYSPSNIKVLRPIAWCSFVSQKYDNAIKYYNKLIEKEATKYDFINLAHSYWLNGSKEKAIEIYKLAKTKYKNNDDFVKDFNEEIKYLNNSNIDDFEIILLKEYLLNFEELDNL